MTLGSFNPKQRPPWPLNPTSEPPLKRVGLPFHPSFAFFGRVSLEVKHYLARVVRVYNDFEVLAVIIAGSGVDDLGDVFDRLVDVYREFVVMVPFALLLGPVGHAGPSGFALLVSNKRARRLV